MGFIEDLKSAITDPTGAPSEGETWEDRQLEAAYTPPSGVRITFDYEDINYKFAHKTSAYEFAGVNGTYVQDHGVTGRRFAWRIFLSGADYDKKAKVFEDALSETGIGVLETPFYGTLDVIPFGEITRRDDLKYEANQAVFEVTFFNTIGAAYPTAETDPASAALAALELFGSAQEADFASSVSLASVSEEQGLLDVVNNSMAQISDKLDRIAAVQETIADEFDEIESTINTTIDTLIAEPLDLAFNMRQLIQTPGRALAGITDRLTAYGNLAGDIFSSSDAISTPGGPGGGGPKIGSNTGVGNDAQEPNKFHMRKVVAGAAVSGAVLSTIYTDTNRGLANANPSVNRRRVEAVNIGISGGDNKFITATDALRAAETVLDQLDAYVDWRDENYVALIGDGDADIINAPSNVDQGEDLRYLKQAVALATGFLIRLSFSLAKERKFILENPRSIIDLCYELYGDVDEYLDFFIESNNFNCNEMLEIPKGRNIVYYE